MKNIFIYLFLLTFFPSYSQVPEPVNNQKESIVLMNGTIHVGNGTVIENGAIGTINATRFATGYKNKLELKIFGDKGAVKIEFEDPITEGSKYMISKDTQREIAVKEDKLKWNEISCSPTLTNFEKFIESIIHDFQ